MTHLTCPFCGKEDFDAYGLKLHLQSERCEPYMRVDLLRLPRSVAKQPTESVPCEKSELGERLNESSCRMCSGDICATHGTDPCQCDVLKRHLRPAATSLQPHPTCPTCGRVKGDKKAKFCSDGFHYNPPWRAS